MLPSHHASVPRPSALVKAGSRCLGLALLGRLLAGRRAVLDGRNWALASAGGLSRRWLLAGLANWRHTTTGEHSLVIGVWPSDGTAGRTDGDLALARRRKHRAVGHEVGGGLFALALGWSLAALARGGFVVVVRLKGSAALLRWCIWRAWSDVLLSARAHYWLLRERNLLRLVDRAREIVTERP